MQNNIQGYKKLIVYQKSKELVLLVYQITKKFPKEERYILLPQLRRATISIMTNVVEGYSKSKREFSRYLDISIGSPTEVGVYLELAYELNYFDKDSYKGLDNLLTEVRKLLYSFQKSLRSSK